MQKEHYLNPKYDFIELMKLLKFQQVAQTGGHAKILIEDGEIFVNGEVEHRKRRKLRVGDIITHQDIQIKIVDHS